MFFLARNNSQKGFAPLVLIILILGILLVAGGIGFYLLQNNNKISNPSLSTKPSATKKIGIIQNITRIDDLVDGYKAKMTELGYKDGSGVLYDYQIANSDPQKLRQIAKDFLAKDYDLIMAISTTAALAVRDEATSSGKTNIPIVFTLGEYSIKLGLIQDYKSPGVNITGIENTNQQNAAKKMDFLKQINPKIKKIGVFIATPKFTNYVSRQSLEEVKAEAQKQGLEVVVYPVDSAPGPDSTAIVKKVADTVKPGDIDAILQIPEPVVNFKDNPEILSDLGLKLKIPTVFLSAGRVEEGGFMSYNANYGTIGAQAAVMTDKIFKGTKPQDIPVEYPLKNQLIFNRQTAQEIGIEIPTSMDAIADKFFDKTVKN